MAKSDTAPKLQGYTASEIMESFKKHGFLNPPYVPLYTTPPINDSINYTIQRITHHLQALVEASNNTIGHLREFDKRMKVIETRLGIEEPEEEPKGRKLDLS